jgi:predicted Rossmann fold nucleotide-binding protein DprA/Smf involved in DNA uptake
MLPPMDAPDMQLAIRRALPEPMARGGPAVLMSGAELVETADDILRELNFNVQKQNVADRTGGRPASVSAAVRLDKGYKILLDAPGFEPASPDALVERTGLPSQSVVSMLLFEELEDLVGLHSGGRWVRL